MSSTSMPVRAGERAAMPWALAAPKVERALFALTVLAAAAMMWLAPRLPMLDLPQHAAQVALWRDLITGQSPWSELVRVNLLTPYLLGYGLMLPLSFVFSMDVVTRLVLTLAFLAFVIASMALRRAFGSDRRLDWLLPLPFFGVGFKLGFLTFMVASPLGLLFILLASRQAQSPGLARGLLLLGAGAVLLMSHGLMFLLAGFLGGLLMLEQLARDKGATPLPRLWPYLALAFLLVAFRAATVNMDGAMQPSGYIFGPPVWERSWIWLLWISDKGREGGLALPLLSCVVLCAPLLYGLPRNRRPALALLGGLVALLALAPFEAFQTSVLFPRFVLLLPVCLVCAFRAAEGASPTPRRAKIAFGFVVFSCWAILAIQAERIWAFGRESQAFETVLGNAKPGRRALALIFDPASQAASNSIVYLHFPAWYQAEKHGFVDFNFAVFHPQVVRFKAGRAPEVDERLSYILTSQSPRLAFSGYDASAYDYIFVRGSRETVDELMQAGAGKWSIAADDGLWRLLERQ